MATLTISLLGPIQVRLDDEILPPARLKKAQALLAYLALEATTAHERERLAMLLWPDQPRTQALQSLRQTLFVLRRAIPTHYVQTTRTAVQFTPQAEYQLDVAQFSDLVDACRRHVHGQASLCTECAERLQEAVALYHGDFLEHFVLPDSESFEEWALLKREWLRREALDALYQLADYYAQGGNHGEAYRCAWRQIELDSLREEAHRQLMQALAQSGRRSEALEQYEHCRRILAELLQAEPAPETTALYEQILSTDVPINAPAQSHRAERLGTQQATNQETRTAKTSLIPTNLPAQLAPLLGRIQEKRELLRLLDDPSVRLLTLIGPGGIGKSHLALEVARQVRGTASEISGLSGISGISMNKAPLFPHGVYWIELTPLSSPAAIAPAIANAVGFALAPSSDPLEQLCAYLRSKRLLLLFDNFEHLLAGAHLVVSLLRAAPDLKIMVTSRARLQLQREQLFVLEGLDVPDPQAVDATAIGACGAVQLFLQQAQRVRLSYAPAAGQWLSIAQICRLLEGMPLGILLAAAWLEHYQPPQIAEQIEQDLDFLAQEWQDVPARHRSMRAVFQHTWHLLTGQERRVFAQLSIFRGGFTVSAAQQVAQATSHVLRSLVDRSLVRPIPDSHGEQRYELHESVRQFAEEKLEEEHTLKEGAHHGHMLFFSRFLQEQHADMGKEQQAGALAAVDVESENVRVAWHWAVSQQQIAQLQQMFPALNHYYQSRSRNQEAEIAFDAATTQLNILVQEEPKPPTLWIDLLSQLLRSRSYYYWFRNDLAQAETLLHQSLALEEELEKRGHDVRSTKAFALRELGRAASSYDRRAARHYFEQSLALYQEADDTWGSLHVLSFLGDIAWNMGDYAGARQYLEPVLTMPKSTEFFEMRSGTLTLLGIVALHQGELAEAERCQRSALEIGHAIGLNIHHPLFYLGMTLVWSGQFEEGIAVLGQRVDEHGEQGRRTQIAAAHACLGEAHLHLGAYAQARSSIETSLQILEEEHEPRQRSASLLAYGQLLLVEGHYMNALEVLQESTQIARTIEQQGVLGWSLACSGYASHALFDATAARRALRESLEIAVATGAYFPLLVALPACALCACEEDPESAVELYFAAQGHDFVANSRWFADVAGRHMGTIMDQLPRPLLHAAKESGRRTDIWQTAPLLLQQMEQICTSKPLSHSHIF